MKIRLSSKLISQIPGITVGAIVIRGINNTRNNTMVKQLLRGVCAAKKKELATEELKEKLRLLLKPTLSEGSVLAETHLLDSLLKKVMKGTEIKSENKLLDLAHHLALKYLTPMQGADLDETEKDLEIDFIVPRQGRKARDLGFSEQSKNIVLWFIDIGNFSKEDFALLPQEFSKVIEKYCGGSQIDFLMLNADEPEVDLQYTSEKEEQYKMEHENEPAEISHDPTEEDQTGSMPIPEFMSASSAQAEPPVFELLLKDVLKANLLKALTNAAPELSLAPETDSAQLTFTTDQLEILPPREQSHGDYATSIALKLGKQMARNPREVAEIIIKHWPALAIIEKTEIAGPGFINFTLSQAYLETELQKILRRQKNYGALKLGHGQKLIVEYSSPNIAKPLGAHHLLSTLIGQVLTNLLRFAGYEIITGNYLGDWGTQFGKLIYAYNNWGNREQIEKDPLNELLKLYVRFHDEVEKESATPAVPISSAGETGSTLEDRGREEFRKLEAGDSENRKLWEWIREISLKDLERLYQILGVHFDEYFPESMYEKAMKEVLEEGKNKGVFVTGEKGALIVKFENDQYPPSLIQKSDGATLYATRDLASLKDRITRFHPDKLLHVVDVAQTLYFKQFFATAAKLGYVKMLTSDGEKSNASPTFEPELLHIVFGRMQFPEGGMSTRKGNIILVDELIKEAQERARKIVDEKSPDLPEAEKKQIVEGMALGAIKYQIVSQNRETNMTFDWDRMLALDGNSAPYLQYTAARAQSILRKAVEQQKTMAQQQANPANQPKNSKKPPKAASLQIDIFEMADRADNDEAIKSTHQGQAEGQSDAGAYQSHGEQATEPFAHPLEQQLLRSLAKFPEQIEHAAVTYKPNILTGYLHELAQTFNTFYHDVPVLTTQNQVVLQARLNLVKAFLQVLKNGLTILGIQTFERM